jgi:hypothetical protein
VENKNTTADPVSTIFATLLLVKIIINIGNNCSLENEKEQGKQKKKKKKKNYIKNKPFFEEKRNSSFR